MATRQDLEQGDIAARQMFGGPLFSPTDVSNIIGAASSAAGSIGRGLTSAINPIESIAKLQNFFSGTSLIGNRRPMADQAAPTLPQLPSGTTVSGSDIYPTFPQMPPSSPSQQQQVASSRPATSPTVAAASPVMQQQTTTPTTQRAAAPNPNAGRTPIQTPFGTIFATQEQAQAAYTPRSQGNTPRTPEQQQALLAQMRERGEAIGSRLAGEQRQNYYATRQGMEQRRAQEALTPSPYEGGTPGRDRRMAGAQALVAAERWRQVAEGTRGAMERTPVSAFGGEFRQGSMGQFSPVQRPSYTTRGLAGGYAPAPITPLSVPSAQDSFASSFATGRAPSIFEDNQPQNSLYLTGSPFIPFRS
jgi:hypothetical protein